MQEQSRETILKLIDRFVKGKGMFNDFWVKQKPNKIKIMEDKVI